MISPQIVEELLKQAKLARDKAYTPYSGFKVGCALMDAHGKIHHGCNIENAAYSPTNCAERTALFSAVANGHKPHTFQAMLVVGDTDGPISPCGVCRQVMNELCAPDMPVYLTNMKGDMLLTTAAALLPGAFGPNDLN